MALIDGRYISRTAGDWFGRMQDILGIEASALGKQPPQYSRKEAVTTLMRLIAQLMGEIDQIPTSLEDVLDPNQMQGAVLRRFAGYAGVSVNLPERSTAALTVTAWTVGAVVLPAGTQATDGVYVWETVDDVTIPQGGSAVVAAQATVDGAILLAADSIQQRRDSVPGWQTVTNASATTPGFDGDSDAAVRQSILRAQGGFGSQSPAAIQYNLENVAGVRNARVVFNPSHGEVTTSGRVIPPTGVGVWIYPNTLPDASKRQCLGLLYALLSGDTNRSIPTTTGADGVRGGIALPYGGQQTFEGFWWMTEQRVYMRIVLEEVAPSYSQDSLLPQIRETALLFFAGLEPGDPVEQQEVLAACTTIPGVRRVAVTLGLLPGSLTDQDIPIDAASFASLDTEDLAVVGTTL